MYDIYIPVRVSEVILRRQNLPTDRHQALSDESAHAFPFVLQILTDDPHVIGVPLP